MSPLRNWKHEKFAQEIAASTDGREAYVIAGYTPNRANHHKLSKHPKVAARIAELKEEREYAACAARVSSSQVLSVLAAFWTAWTAWTAPLFLRKGGSIKEETESAVSMHRAHSVGR
jgi:hypothetical protein